MELRSLWKHSRRLGVIAVQFSSMKRFQKSGGVGKMQELPLKHLPRQGLPPSLTLGTNGSAKSLLVPFYLVGDKGSIKAKPQESHYFIQ